jgi:hypothetical protein
MHQPDVVFAQHTASGQQRLKHAHERLKLGPPDKPLGIGDQVFVAGAAAPKRFNVLGQMALVKGAPLLRRDLGRPVGLAPTPCQGHDSRLARSKAGVAPQLHIPAHLG